MSLIPTAPLSPIALLAKAVQLYGQTFVAMLPFVFIIIGFHFIIGVLPHLSVIPASKHINTAFMMGSILLMPIIGGFIIFQHGRLSQPLSIAQSLSASFGQLIPLLLSLVYLAFIPLILIAIGVACFVFLDPEKINFSIRLGILVASGVGTILVLTSKILTPIIVVLDKMDANSAQEQASKLSQGSYVKTLCLACLPMLAAIKLFWIPTALNLTLTSINIPYAYLVFQGVGDAILGVFGPLLSMIILLYVNDLTLRKQGLFATEKETAAKQYQDAALKAKTPTDDNMF
jgi:hypothetical protein